ncbi:MAG: hypothetical protein SPL13_02500 [Clostridia bacterium]|nr:hypothetical protein [Clostridia bacterium]
MKTLFKKILPIFLAAAMGLSVFAFTGCTKVLYGNMPQASTESEDDKDDGVKDEKTISTPSTYVDLTNDNTQYVVFMLTNTTYQQDESFLFEMQRLHGENDPKSERMYAFGTTGPYILNHSIETMRENVNTVFQAAERYNIPVYFQMDDCKQFFTTTPNNINKYGDEENCVHVGKTTGVSYNHFYEDPDMCEWIALPSGSETWGGQSNGELPKWMMDWGSPYARVLGGFPCFNSESYLEWYDNQIKEGFIKPLLENLIRLQKEGKDYLFAGVCTGWETMLPDYSSDAIVCKGSAYSGVKSWERTQYGMHAIYNIKDDYGNRLYDTDAKLAAGAQAHGLSLTAFKRYLLFQVIHDYIEHTCKLFYDAGISRYKIYSHTIAYTSGNGGDEFANGNATYNASLCDTFALPSWVAINDYCIPGWSIASTIPYDTNVILKNVAKYAPGLNAYASVEAYANDGGGNEANCRAYMERLLGGNSKLLPIFGYEQDTKATSTLGYSRDGDYFFTKLIRQWREGTFLSGYSFANRPALTY